MKWIKEKYNQWCKETKRNGSVLVGGSINEFFDWLIEQPTSALPDPYSGGLNTKRIAEYKRLHQLFNVDEGTVRDIFSAGIDFYKMECTSSAPNLPEETFIIREINTDKYYWCKCENCGWEDSSEFCEGCHPIADTGDNTDPLCPVCGCNKLEGEPALIEPESYSGIVKVKIPFDAVIEPLKKTIKQQEKIIEDLRWSNSTPIGNLPVATPAPIREGVDAEGLLNEILQEDANKGLLQDTVITRKHNGLEYDMVRKDLAVIAMKEFASRFTAPTGAGSVNTLLAEVLYKYIKYIRDVDGTDYILVHDERYASDVKFTDEQWQLLTDVAKK